MNSVMQSLGALLRLAFTSSEPTPHPIVDDVERAAQVSERESEKVDNFAMMIHGMKSHGSVRPKKKQSKTRRG